MWENTNQNNSNYGHFLWSIIDWIKKWLDKISELWKEFIRPDNCKAGKMYGIS